MAVAPNPAPVLMLDDPAPALRPPPLDDDDPVPAAPFVSSSDPKYLSTGENMAPHVFPLSSTPPATLHQKIILEQCIYVVVRQLRVIRTAKKQKVVLELRNAPGRLYSL